MLSMILHELDTNACKYGALALESACISVTWQAIPVGSDAVMASAVGREDLASGNARLQGNEATHAIGPACGISQIFEGLPE